MEDQIEQEPEFARRKSVSRAEAAECIKHGWGFDVEEGSECWTWRCPASTGYGPFKTFWEAQGSRLDPNVEQELHHTCFRGPAGCVNPDHVVALTPEQHEHAHRFAQKNTVQQWADALRQERMVRGWSQAQLADVLGVAQQTVKAWEQAVNGPSRTLQKIIAAELGWELAPRKFVVTYALQDVVVARSSGEAVRKVRASLPEAMEGVRKHELVEVRVVK